METLYLQILNMSITGSCVIMAVLLGRLLLQKAPKKYSYTLWAAAGFRLVCPVSFQSVVSLFSFSRFENRTNGATLTHIPADIGLMAAPQGSTGAPVLDNVVNNQLPAATPEASVNPMQVLIFVGMVVWLTGVAVMAVASIVNYVRLKKSLRFAVRLEGNVWQCETVRSPFLIGLVKPKIYLPYGLDSQTENYILAHEKYHLKRFDHVVKLLAYAVLTLHWFNPLCHIAFRLMNRDMEMSCDEHVLAEKGIATTAYSESLLTIATNRRYPAATPLDFAETGVKERMMNVLKWRKPKAWVSVVAVLVCVVTLISCAANPKLSEPKVDDPSLLEFPGIKWGATPEEVKEALGITKDQIISEEIDPKMPDSANGYDRYLLSATDLTLYEREVTYAYFQFRQAPDDAFALERVLVMFTEDTDMEQLKEDLAGIYGPGSDEPYSFYMYYNNIKRDHELIPHAEESLRYLANQDEILDGVEGNPFRDALADPDYMTHYWVTENGCSVIPEEVVEYFKYMMAQPWNERETALQDDETMMAMLDQMPWVHMTIGNRFMSTIARDAQGSEEHPYYTNIYMEFNASWLAEYVHKAETYQDSEE